jgi:hypothetical protein
VSAAAASSAGRKSSAAARQGPADPLAAVVFVLLALACVGALFLTQRLKHTATVVQEVRLAAAFAPTSAAGGPTEAISFRIAHDDDVTVAVIDGSGNRVATIIADHPLHRYRHLYLHWNGHTGTCPAPTAATCASAMTGPLAAPGSYRLRITLVGEHRTVDSPNAFRLLAAQGAGA